MTLAIDQPRLSGMRIRAGVWEGVLAGHADAPAIEVWHAEARLGDVEVTPAAQQDGRWLIRVPIPASLLSDGVQTFIVREAGRTETLAHFTIITGVALEDDLRAEIDLLRAELDMLKRAFRRHCLETRG